MKKIDAGQIFNLVAALGFAAVATAYCIAGNVRLGIVNFVFSLALAVVGIYYFVKKGKAD